MEFIPIYFLLFHGFGGWKTVLTLVAPIPIPEENQIEHEK